MKPLVTIIIPLFNKEQYIKECLDSIITQSYTNFEVLILDDGSSDGSQRVIEEYLFDDRIKYFYKKNEGVSKTRNHGITIAQGDYIVFLDADDSIQEKFLEKMVNEAMNFSSVVCCAHNKINMNTGIIRKSNSNFKSDILISFLLNRLDINTNSWLISKNFLLKNKILFDTDLMWGEDMLFFIKVLALSNSVKYVDEPLTNYNIQVSNSLSSFKKEKLSQDVIWVNRAIEFLKSNNFKKEYINALWNYRLPSLITYGLYSLKNEMSLEEYNDLKKAYYKYYQNLKFNNGLRSIKTWLYKKKI